MEKIVIIEYDKEYMEYTRIGCEKGGHQVVARFKTENEAIQGITSGFTATMVILGEKASNLSDMLRKKYPSIIMIQYSSESGLSKLFHNRNADAFLKRSLDDKKYKYWPEILR